MPAPKYPTDDTATALVTSHGRGARQKVVDQIITCIREHDVRGAKTWEEVGRKVDEALGLVVAIEVDNAMEKAITAPRVDSLDTGRALLVDGPANAALLL